MSVGAPNSRSRHSSFSAWIRSVAFVVVALCLAFTEGQEPSVWQSVATDIVPKATLGGLNPHRAPTLDDTHPDGAALNCGFCQTVLKWFHYATMSPFCGLGTYGRGDHGWHDFPVWGRYCDYEHGLCVCVPSEGAAQTNPTNPTRLTDEIAQAVAEHNIALLAVLLEQPAVRVNAIRGAIQVTGCDGTAIAGHVQVGRDILEAAELLAAESLDSEL